VPRGYKEGNWRRKTRIWNGDAVQRELEVGSRGIATVRSFYQTTTSDDTAGSKRHRDFVKCGNSDSVIVIYSYHL
jgi:hypothetical protein